jgi:hypothetical protein
MKYSLRRLIGKPSCVKRYLTCDVYFSQSLLEDQLKRLVACSSKISNDLPGQCSIYGKNKVTDLRQPSRDALHEKLRGPLSAIDRKLKGDVGLVAFAAPSLQACYPKSLLCSVLYEDSAMSESYIADSHMCVSIRCDIVDDDIMERVDAFLSACDGIETCYQGILDVSPFDETHIPGSLESTSLEPRQMAHSVERIEFLCDVQLRRNRVRGVYWGHFLGSEMMSRLPAGVFDEFRQQSRGTPKPELHCKRFARGGAVFCMNSHPILSIGAGGLYTTDNMVCFRSLLAEHGLLWTGINPKLRRAEWTPVDPSEY